MSIMVTCLLINNDQYTLRIMSRFVLLSPRSQEDCTYTVIFSFFFSLYKSCTQFNNEITLVQQDGEKEKRRDSAMERATAWILMRLATALADNDDDENEMIASLGPLYLE